MAIHQDVQCAETPDAREKPRPFLQSKPPGDGAFYPLSILCKILSAKITAPAMIEFRAGAWSGAFQLTELAGCQDRGHDARYALAALVNNQILTCSPYIL